MMKLLLQTCCAPCFLGVWEELRTHDFAVTSFYYNPNIFPAEEYDRRLAGLKKVSGEKEIGLVVGDYDPELYFSATNDKKDEFPARCLECYHLRLGKTAEFASKNGFDAFSTTLLVSPYQQHDKLNEIGEKLSKKYGVRFYYTDWRPYFREGQNEAKTQDIYRQKYCGCKYSLETK